MGEMEYVKVGLYAYSPRPGRNGGIALGRLVAPPLTQDGFVDFERMEDRSSILDGKDTCCRCHEWRAVGDFAPSWKTGYRYCPTCLKEWEEEREAEIAAANGTEYVPFASMD